MTDYLSKPGFDFESEQMAIDYDQNPNWSPYFGELIFAHLPLRKNLRVLDVACGTGYPSLELSQRLGPSSEVVGVDIWEAGLQRARQKAAAFELQNVSFLNEDATATRFPGAHFDLIVSNVGVNNFEEPKAVFAECHRISKPGAFTALTTNPRGHMAEFYEVFEKALRDLNLEESLVLLEEHLSARHSTDRICGELESVGFSTTRLLESAFEWRFVDGTAFLNTFHIVYGFLPGWKGLVPEERQVEVFGEVERQINAHAERHGEFSVSVPVRYIEATKPA